MGQLARNPVGEIKKYISDESVKKRFEEMLGKRGGAFLNSIINVVRGSKALQNCSPESIMSAAVVAATLNLPIDPALGQAAIVPYGSTANFQLMYKGIIQLCIRSGKYQSIHCSEIYKDELKSHNPITGVVKFHDPDTYKMRDSGKGEVVGHYSYFKLISGFEKSDFMTVKQVMAHAERFSKAYQRDIKKKLKDSPWSIFPMPMGNKTVLLRLLNMWGIKSIEMQDAIVRDNSFEAAEEKVKKQIESEQGSVPVDTEFEEKQEAPNEQLTSQQKAARTRKANAQKKALQKADAKGKAEFLYTCLACKAKGKPCGFDEPKMSGPESDVPICPNCLKKDIVSTEDEKPAFMND